MATHKTARRTTAKARPTCGCPLCAGTVAAANGVYACRADTTIEYVIVNSGEYLGTRATEMSAKSELASYRRDQLARPIEQAAAEADIEAEVAAFVAEVAAANPDALELNPLCIWCGDEVFPDSAGFPLACPDHIDEVNCPGGNVDYSGEAANACACGAPLAGDGCTSKRCINYPPTLDLPPYIYMAADGLTFAGAGRSYATWIDADVARSEWLAAA